MTTLYEQRASPIEGIGCFAIAPIPADTLVEQWEGDHVTTAKLQQIVDDGLYYSAVAIGEDEHLLLNTTDPRAAETTLPVGSGTGGFNHSCDSNLWLEDAVTVIARQGIEAGVELTLDYALFSVDPEWEMTSCNCGSPFCRGIVTGADWRLPEIQERYAGHFSPFINERIARLPP